MADSDILARLSSFIDYESPELAEFVYRMIEDQGYAITYRELRQAILDGGLSLDYLRQWQQDYSRFINEAYSQAVERAVAQAAADLRLEYGVNFYDPMFSKIDNFIQTHGGQLIRQVSIEQYTAINQLVRQATLTTSMTVDQLARVIRPCVGLTRRQAQTTKNFYDSLIKDGYSDKRARERQLVYAAKIHRQRAAMIAETEMATAYNAGWQATIQQNVEDGILPPGTRKQWLTAEDEKVCPICGGMREETVLWNEPFSNGSDYPPAHPRCRCHYKIIFVDLLQQPDNQQRQQTAMDEQIMEEEEEQETTQRETSETTETQQLSGPTDEEGDVDTPTLTPEAPPDDVEAALNIKRGASMDITDAATGANPNYNTSHEYNINCQRCVQSYEFRRRGYDVEALPRPSTGNTITWGSECFPTRGKTAHDAFKFRQTEAAVKRELNSAPDDSRYVIYARWKGRNSSAHVFIAEKHGGKVQYIDPQSGQIGVDHYFSLARKGNFGYYRIDDKPIVKDKTIITETVKGKVIKWIRRRLKKYSSLIENLMRRRSRNTDTR